MSKANCILVLIEPPVRYWTDSAAHATMLWLFCARQLRCAVPNMRFFIVYAGLHVVHSTFCLAQQHAVPCLSNYTKQARVAILH